MKLHIFSIPALAPEAAQEALNRHLAMHRVAHLDKQFVSDGSASYWSVCVTTVDAAVEPSAGDAQRRGRSVDYREVLQADEFGLYDRLRGVRKGLAEAEGLPPYAVFTNEQLAAMVRGRVVTAAALGAIEGVGEARMRRYADSFLPVLGEGVPKLLAKAATPAAG